ncbi:MAG: oligosaccharide flippase family protein, partial [Pseudomonadota bacterium]
LNLGRLTAIDVVTQLSGIVSAVAIAYVTQSVWALVFSGIISMFVQLWLFTWLLEGHRNSFGWEKPAARELINFGKWIFVSTIAGFVAWQSDKLLIGAYLPLDQFGVYNIGFFLASFPILLGNVIIHKLLIPLYRERPPSESHANFSALRKMRFTVTSALMGMAAVLAFIGAPLVEILYDDRYLAAGGVVVLIACMQVPQIIAITYDQAALAAGDSRRYFVLQALRAVFMVAGILAGLQIAGLIGALVGIGAAMLCAYPVVVWLARRMQAWDPLHDVLFALAGGIMILIALWLNWDAIEMLSAMQAG